MTGSARPSVMDVLAFQSWMLRFITSLGSLREDMAVWNHWIANGSPSWAAYRDIMVAGMVTLDK